jgi:hypothetical protein
MQEVSKEDITPEYKGPFDFPKAPVIERYSSRVLARYIVKHCYPLDIKKELDELELQFQLNDAMHEMHKATHALKPLKVDATLDEYTKHEKKRRAANIRWEASMARVNDLEKKLYGERKK